jgi:hypothetical protein
MKLQAKKCKHIFPYHYHFSHSTNLPTALP